MGPGALAQVLRRLEGIARPAEFPDLIAGLEGGDDSAVWRLTDSIAIVQTLDFFAPIVDDPYQYGAIAAANAMSDVYAMGGEVLLALNICGFPERVPLDIVGEILRGGAEKVREAGGILAGGHTVIGSEPTYGMAVTGVVDPGKVLFKRGAHPGDLIVLTKPIGTGIIATAAKGDVADPAHLAGAVESMARLNRNAARLFQEVGVDACTDVTGFSLIGHAFEIAEKSGVRIRLDPARVPVLPGSAEYAEGSLFPAGTYSNRSAYETIVRFGGGVAEEMRLLMFVPETSGGLLAAVPPESAARLESLFRDRGEPAWFVGEVLAGSGVEVAGP